MGGWDAPTARGATGTGVSGRRRRSKKQITITKETATTPPTAPPTMTAVFELLEEVSEEAPEAGFTVEVAKPKSDDALPVVNTETP